MRDKLLGLGGLQVTVTAALVMGIAVLFGQPWNIALGIGLVFSLSSTAIVLQTLNEKGLTRTEGGQATFSVLLFQDIAPQARLERHWGPPLGAVIGFGIALAGHMLLG